MIKLVYMQEDGKVNLSREELEGLIKQSFEEGYFQGRMQGRKDNMKAADGPHNIEMGARRDYVTVPASESIAKTPFDNLKTTIDRMSF